MKHATGTAAMMTWIKTCSFTAMHFVIAFTVVYLMTGDVFMGGAVALIEPACNSIGFFFHEKVWARMSAGRGGALAAH